MEKGDTRLEKVDYPSPWICGKSWEVRGELSEHEGSVANPWHFHPEIEWLAILEGSMRIDTADRSYTLRPGSVLLLGSNELHRSVKQGMIRYIVYQVDLKQLMDSTMLTFAPVLLEMGTPLTRFNELLIADNQLCSQMHQLVRTILSEFEVRKLGFEIAVSAYTKMLLLHLIRSQLYEAFSIVNNENHLRFLPVFQYIDQNYAKPIHVQDVLNLVHLSYHHFIKLFKQTAGLSFVDYVQMKRIRAAERLLATEHCSINEVLEKSGFSSTAQFYRVFDQFHKCSPNAYRKRMMNP